MCMCACVCVHVCDLADVLRCVCHNLVEMNKKMLLPWKLRGSNSHRVNAMPCTFVTDKENFCSNLLVLADNNNKVLWSEF